MGGTNTALYLLQIIFCNSFCTYTERLLTCTSWHIINYSIVYLLKAFENDESHRTVSHCSADENVGAVILIQYSNVFWLNFKHKKSLFLP